MTEKAADITTASDHAYWILDFCAGCDRLVWMDLMDQLCPECLGG